MLSGSQALLSLVILGLMRTVAVFVWDAWKWGRGELPKDMQQCSIYSNYL